MTESPPAPDASLTASPTGAPARPSRWKQATLAGVLSFFFSGMGQLYNRQPRRALIIGGVSYLFILLPGHTRVLFAFRTMVAVILAGIVWKLLVVGDAVYAAGRSEKAESRVPVPWIIYSVLAVLLFLAALGPSIEAVKKESGFSAFVIPSRSMCPTICLGDRIVADMHAYRSQPPQRGDVILMKHTSSEALFVKRVIGIPGDTVSPGPDGSVLVNGRAFRAPAPCAMAVWKKPDGADYNEFQVTKVLEGNYFVIGDNLPDSFDSRIAEFGVVTREMVRGRPLYLYWSPVIARIGCSIH